MPPSSSSKNKVVLGVVFLVLLLSGVGVYFYVRQAPEVAPAPVIEKGPVKEVIGTSVEGRVIESYTYGQGDKHLVFVGGVHGGYEWNSVLLAYQFMDYLDANPTVIPQNLTVSVIPSANPDGVFKVIGKEGRFSLADAPTDRALTAPGRFNANAVDLNRNFDCKWKPESMWQSKTVSAGTAPFSEPEAQALRDYALKYRPDAFVFWHSQANAVYASECEAGILPETLSIMNTYSKAAGYQPISSFDAYPISGDVEGWLASINIPAITVELQTHETVEWDRNLAGIQALFNYYKDSAVAR
jgi:predicted deacylase